MEIERKFLVKNIPPVLDNCNKRYIEQAYLCTSPTVRVRRDNDDYYLTYKGPKKKETATAAAITRSRSNRSMRVKVKNLQ